MKRFLTLLIGLFTQLLFFAQTQYDYMDDDAVAGGVGRAINGLIIIVGLIVIAFVLILIFGGFLKVYYWFNPQANPEYKRKKEFQKNENEDRKVLVETKGSDTIEKSSEKTNEGIEGNSEIQKLANDDPEISMYKTYKALYELTEKTSPGDSALKDLEMRKMYSEDGQKLISTYNGTGGKGIKVDFNPKKGTRIICDYAYDERHSYASSIVIPDTVVALGYYAFMCIFVEELTIPPSVRYITGNPFGRPYGCYKKFKCNSKYFKFENDVLVTSDNSLYIANNNNSRIISVPLGVKIVGRGAIRGHDEVELIRVSSSVIALAEESFSFCINLSVLVFDGKVCVIEPTALKGCKKLRYIFVPIGLKEHYQKILPNEYSENVLEISSKTKSNEQLLFDVLSQEDKRKRVQAATKQPNRPVISIEDRNLINKIKKEYELTVITPKEKEEKVVDWGDFEVKERWYKGLASYSKDGKKFLEFEGGIDEYTIKEGTEVICDYSLNFYNNGRFSFPNTTKVLGNFLFSHPPFEDITIPESVISITGNPFATCDIKLHCNSPFFYFDGNVLYDKDRKIIVSVMKHFQIIEKDKPVTFSEKVRVIGRDSFYGIFLPKTIILPDSVLYIGDSAFCNAYIHEIKLGESVLEIGEYAFAFSSIEKIEMPDTLEILGDFAFSCCEFLKSVKFSASLTTIGKGTFSNCKGLINVYIPEGVKAIKTDAFNMCENLISISLPNSLELIEEGAFSFCGFKTVLVSKQTKIEDGAFMGDCTIIRRD